MENKHLAIASVPLQPWGKLYGEEEAFCCGTVFTDLNKPFFAASDNSCHCHKARSLSASESRQQELMKKLNTVSFYLDDLGLFLDTHPACAEAISLYREKLQERKQLLSQFSEEFYPLTKASITKNTACESFCWAKGPAPWEGACV